MGESMDIKELIVIYIFIVFMIILVAIPTFTKGNDKWNEEKRERLTKIASIVCVSTMFAIIIICILYSLWCKNIS